MSSWIERYESFWSRRVSGASLSLFRILLGLFLIADAVFFNFNLHGEFGHPKITFEYPGLEWWPFHSLQATSAVLWLMTAGGVLVTLGAWTRAGLCLGALGASQLLLRDASFFMNHLALVSTLCVACVLAPMDRYYALKPRLPFPRDRSIALCELAIPVAILWIGYFFGGLSKLRPEWFSGELFRNLLEHAGHKHVLSRALGQLGCNKALSWSGLLLDLGAPLGLSWRRTRAPMALALIAFHLMNHELFSIGLFSFLMLAGFALYFPPDWPEKLRAGVAFPARLDPPLPESSRMRWARPAIAAVLVLLAARQYVFPVLPALSGQGSWYGWRWTQAKAPSCFVTYSKLAGAELQTVMPEELTAEQRTRLNTSVGLAWRYARDRYCPSWGSVYAQWRCNRDPEKILSLPSELVRHLDSTIDLCATDYSRLGLNRWVKP